MASQIRNIQKKLSGHVRKGRNTRGKRKGPAQLRRKPFTPAVYPIGLADPAAAVSDYYHARADCCSCRGEGVVLSAYAHEGQSVPVTCRCVFQGGSI